MIPTLASPTVSAVSALSDVLALGVPAGPERPDFGALLAANVESAAPFPAPALTAATRDPVPLAAAAAPATGGTILPVEELPAAAATLDYTVTLPDLVDAVPTAPLGFAAPNAPTELAEPRADVIPATKASPPRPGKSIAAPVSEPSLLQAASSAQQDKSPATEVPPLREPTAETAHDQPTDESLSVLPDAPAPIEFMAIPVPADLVRSADQNQSHKPMLPPQAAIEGLPAASSALILSPAKITPTPLRAEWTAKRAASLPAAPPPAAAPSQRAAIAQVIAGAPALPAQHSPAAPARLALQLRIQVAALPLGPGLASLALKPSPQEVLLAAIPVPDVLTGTVAPAPLNGVPVLQTAPLVMASERPLDFTAVLDRLAAARDAVQVQPAALTVAHSEFGPVQLSFRHDERGLAVTMASADPDFARAVAAVPPPVMPASQAQSAGSSTALAGQRGDTAPSGQGAAGNHARSQQADRRDEAAAHANTMPEHSARGAPKPARHRGIFA